MNDSMSAVSPRRRREVIDALRRGTVPANGLDLLAHQAVGQVRLMTGRDVAAEVLLSAGRAALGATSGSVKD